MSTLRPSTLAIALLLSAATFVSAQTARPERPYRGLFAEAQPSSGQTLSLFGSLGGGYDTDLLQELRESTRLDARTSAQRHSGGMGQMSGALQYTAFSARGTVSAAARTSGRYYPSGDLRKFVRRDTIDFRGSTEPGLGLTLTGGGIYSPFRMSDLYETSFLQQAGEASDDFDFGSSSLHYIGYFGMAQWAWHASQRTTVSSNYRYSGRMASNDLPDHHVIRTGGDINHSLAKGLSLNLGYRYTQSSYSSKGTYVTHGIKAGVDYSRALSFSRRTTLTFGTGTDAYKDPTQSGELSYRAVGNAALNHEIGRTWSASLAYNRNVRFTETLLEPVVADSVILSLVGPPRRSISVHARAGAGTGRYASLNGQAFDTRFADAGAQFALAKNVALGTSYRYYHHLFGHGVALVPGIPDTIDRHSVQAFLSLWAPIYRSDERVRRP